MPGTITANEQLRQGHQGGVNTGYVNPLFVEEYSGAVEHRIKKKSFMKSFVNIKNITGTDTLSNDQIGSTSLQKVTRGTRPTDSGTTFDSVSIKVDTMVLARTNQHKMDDFFGRYSVRKEVGMEHGTTIGEFVDEAFLVQSIKAAQVSVLEHGETVPVGGWQAAFKMGGGAVGTTPAVITRSAPKGFEGGNVIILEQANDENVAVDFDLAVRRLTQMMEEKDVEIEDGVLLVRPAQYNTLLDNDKLISKDFSDANGDFAKGMVLLTNNLRVMKTNRFPKAADVGETHFLSNAGNGNAYDVTQADANCVAVLMLPKALLAGETIPLTSDVYYVKQELQWFIDSYLMFAVTPGRLEYAGALFKHAPTVA
jgi:hypothetical protein